MGKKNRKNKGKARKVPVAPYSKDGYPDFDASEFVVLPIANHYDADGADVRGLDSIYIFEDGGASDHDLKTAREALTDLRVEAVRSAVSQGQDGTIAAEDTREVADAARRLGDLEGYQRGKAEFKAMVLELHKRFAWACHHARKRKKGGAK